MKITGAQLKQLIDARVRRALERPIVEGSEQNTSTDEPDPCDSLDAQVDQKLIEYEHVAKTAKNEGFDVRSIAYRMMFEATADDDDELAAALSGDDDQEGSSNQQGRPGVRDIDVHEFASNVARLIDNVENLLEFKDTLYRRTLNFLKMTYDVTVLDQFKRVMERQFGIVLGEDDVDKEFDVTAPPAVGAGVPSGE